MGLTLNPRLETEIRARADAEGVSVEAYIERLLEAEEEAMNEAETLALEGVKSGNAMEAGVDYWENMHRRLDERIKRSSRDLDTWSGRKRTRISKNILPTSLKSRVVI